MASPIQELFHLLAGKNSQFAPKRVLKHLLSELQYLQDFKGRERSLPNKGVGHSGTTRNFWEDICSFHQQRSPQVNLFVIVLPVAPQIVQIWEEKAPE